MIPPASQDKLAAAREKLIVALDFAAPGEALALVKSLGDCVSFLKIGLELAYGAGLPLAEELASSGKQVFLDLKLHDIPATVSRACAQAAKLGAGFLSVHAYPQTMKAARLATAGTPLRLLGVTVLTSCDDSEPRLAMRLALPASSRGVRRKHAKQASTGSYFPPMRPRPRARVLTAIFCL